MRYEIVRRNDDDTYTVIGYVYARSLLHALQRKNRICNGRVCAYPVPIEEMKLERELVELQERLARTVEEFATRVISQMEMESEGDLY
jgi:hypothetical protein